jgi:hypothetical protein
MLRKKFFEEMLKKFEAYAERLGDSPEMVIYKHLASGGTITALARDAGIERSTMSKLLTMHPPYTQARDEGRKDGADALADDTRSILEGLVDKEGLTSADVALARERVQNLKWHAGVNNPDRFGKQDQQVTVNIGELHLEALRKPMRVINEVAKALPDE